MAGRLAMLAVAGALGTLARYGLSGLVHRWTGAGYPWGTLAVNALGCLLFGILVSFAGTRLWIGGEVRIVVLVGFMGAFTTFSSFAYETNVLFADSEWIVAGLNVLAQNVVGLLAMFLGLAVGRAL
jgi:CrcB protein